MMVAITVWGNRISPVFDSAQTVLLAELLDKQVVDKRLEFIPLLVPECRARKVVALNPDALICGAISEQPARIIEHAGIRLLPFISGTAERVLHVYAQTFDIDNYRMPGCSNRCQQKHHCHLKSEFFDTGSAEGSSGR